jgi:glycosyltransferase involved in cell wall biosynthesis
MRICLVSYEFPPSGGGEASYVSGLATGLGRLGHEVFVVTPQGAEPEESGGLFKIIPTRPGRGLIREVDFILQAERTVSYLAGRGLIDVVHVTFDYPTFFLRLRRFGVPCVATVHHLHLVEALAMLAHQTSAPTKVASVLKASILTSLEGRLVRQCGAVIAVSRFTAETVRRFLSVTPDDLRIVKNGIDASAFERGDPGRFRERYPALGDKTVLCVGRLERSKGLHYLIPAFARVLSRVPEATLAVVGRGSDGYLQELKLAARSAGVSDKVVFTGRIPQALLPDAYAASAVVVLPSLMEGFGISVLESMASCRPCVATRVGAVPEILRNGETGLLVKPADPEGLADAMAALLSNPDLCRAMGKKGREVVTRDFSLERMTADTLGVYQRLVADAKPPG